MNERLLLWLLAVGLTGIFAPLDESHISWLAMGLVSAGAVAFYIYTAWRNRDVPKTREEMLRKQVAEAAEDLAEKNNQLNIMLDNMVRDRGHLRELERTNADLQHENERLAAAVVPARRSRAAVPAPYTSPRDLSADQKMLLRDELLKAYPTRDAWEALLQDIDHPLDLAIGDNLTIIAGKVIAQAQAAGWLESLMVMAAQQRPNLPELKKLTITLLDALGS